MPKNVCFCFFRISAGFARYVCINTYRWYFSFYGPQSSLSEKYFSVLDPKSVNGTPPVESVVGVCDPPPDTNRYWKQPVSQMDWQTRSRKKKKSTYSLSSFGRWLNDSGSKDSMLLKCRYLKSTVCVQYSKCALETQYKVFPQTWRT